MQKAGTDILDFHRTIRTPAGIALHSRGKRLKRVVLEQTLRAAAQAAAMAPGEVQRLGVGELARIGQDPDRILVLQLFALGDLVLTVPALRALRRRFPDSDIVLGVLDFLAPLAARIDAVDEVVPVNGTSIKKNLPTLRRLGRWHPQLAVVFNPLLLGGWFGRLSHAPLRLGYAHDRYDAEVGGRQDLAQRASALFNLLVEPAAEPRHEVERYAELLSVLGVTMVPDDFYLQISSSDRRFQEWFCSDRGIAADDVVIGIHVGAKWAGRRWLADRYAAVADFTADRYHAKMLFFGSGSDSSLVEAVRGQMQQPSLSAVGATNLTELAAVIARCNGYIGNDSGPLHIAAGMGVPSVALFGPGNETKFRPYRVPHAVVSETLPCRPCPIQFLADCPSNICMTRITEAQVRDAVCHVFDHHLC